MIVISSPGTRLSTHHINFSPVVSLNFLVVSQYFCSQECEPLGAILGTGGTSVVREVDFVRLLKDETPSSTSPANANTQVVPQSMTEDDNNCRLELVNSLKRRNGQPRYVIKKLSRATILKASSAFEDRRREFMNGVVDLAMEVEFLKALDGHPHIINLRGTSSAHPCSSDFFLILDCLAETFMRRFAFWKKSKRKISGYRGFFSDRKGLRKTSLFFERLSVAYQICSALQFIHSKR